MAKEIGTRSKIPASAIVTYFRFEDIRSSNFMIKNRRQHRLWNVIDKPYREFLRGLYRRVVEEVADDILYGKGGE